jgi:mRNA interferase MazF
MASFKKFDVIVVPFPFIDSELVKKRPALVLSGSQFNSETQMVTCAMITSSSKDMWSSDVDLKDFSKAGLKKKCKVRFKLFSIQSNLILSIAGRISTKDQSQVETSFSKIFQ